MEPKNEDLEAALAIARNNIHNAANGRYTVPFGAFGTRTHLIEALKNDGWTKVKGKNALKAPEGWSPNS